MLLPNVFVNHLKNRLFTFIIHLQKQWFTHKVYIHFKTYNPGSILEIKGMHAIFQKKGENYQKRQNIWKFGQKYRKFENILKKGRWLRAITAHNNYCKKLEVIEIISTDKSLNQSKVEILQLLVQVYIAFHDLIISL